MPDNTRRDAAKPGTSGEQQGLGKDGEHNEQPGGQLEGLWGLLERYQQEIEMFLPGVNGQPPTPLSPATLERVVRTSENMALAHEIAVNADFKLKSPSEEESEQTVHGVVRRTMHTAYWNLVQEDLSRDPPSYELAMKILTDVKKSFKVLLRGNNERALARLNGMLDEERIQQQVEFGTLDIRSITNYVIELMGKACAMNRDNEVAALKRQTDTVAILRGIMETLDNMKIDMANYILHITHIQVMRSSIDYEKEKFNELKQVCGDNFPLTLEWLLRHIPPPAGGPAGHDDNTAASTTPAGAAATPAPAPAGAAAAAADQEGDQDDDGGVAGASNEMTPAMATAYAALLDYITPPAIPELLKLDQDRFYQMRIEAMRLCICATVLQLTVSVMPVLRDQTDKRQELADKLMVLFDGCNSKESVLELLEGMWAFVLKFVDEQQPLDTPMAVALKYQIGKVAANDSPVYPIIWNRLQTTLASVLTKGCLAPIHSCYQNLRPQVKALAGKLMRVAEHNYAVYGDYYAYLINRQPTA
ncbi:T-complex protein 11-like protein 1 [Anopheles aquasalis]|uniref:T-complex protein 11-like protein 1 n=1 Tax=Anopheles aquasalis TaxID=42839 RepID=UPI00215AAD60|nr:T-complex protein 11-like protein 1 [Anopheles aquasalis]